MSRLLSWLIVVCVCVSAQAAPVCEQFELLNSNHSLVKTCAPVGSGPASVTVDCAEGPFDPLGFADTQLLLQQNGTASVSTGAGFPGPFTQAQIPAALWNGDTDPNPGAPPNACHRRARNFSECLNCSLRYIGGFSLSGFMENIQGCRDHCTWNGNGSPIGMGSGCNTWGCLHPPCPTGCVLSSIEYPECCFESGHCYGENLSDPLCPSACQDLNYQPCQPWPSCYECMEHPSDPECAASSCSWSECYPWCAGYPNCP